MSVLLQLFGDPDNPGYGPDANVAQNVITGPFYKGNLHSIDLVRVEFVIEMSLAPAKA